MKSGRPALDWPKTCRVCKTCYSEARWDKLTLVGYQPDPECVIEMRNCPCGSTMAIDWPKPRKNPYVSPISLRELKELVETRTLPIATYLVLDRAVRDKAMLEVSKMHAPSSLVSGDEKTSWVLLVYIRITWDPSPRFQDVLEAIDAEHGDALRDAGFTGRDGMYQTYLRYDPR